MQPEPALTDPGNAGQRHQAGDREQAPDLGGLPPPAHKARRLDRKIARPPPRPPRPRRWRPPSTRWPPSRRGSPRPFALPLYSRLAVRSVSNHGSSTAGVATMLGLIRRGSPERFGHGQEVPEEEGTKEERGQPRQAPQLLTLRS